MFIRVKVSQLDEYGPAFGSSCIICFSRRSWHLTQEFRGLTATLLTVADIGTSDAVPFIGGFPSLSTLGSKFCHMMDRFLKSDSNWSELISTKAPQCVIPSIVRVTPTGTVFPIIAISPGFRWRLTLSTACMGSNGPFLRTGSVNRSWESHVYLIPPQFCEQYV